MDVQKHKAQKKSKFTEAQSLTCCARATTARKILSATSTKTDVSTFIRSLLRDTGLNILLHKPGTLRDHLGTVSCTWTENRQDNPAMVAMVVTVESVAMAELAEADLAVMADLAATALARTCLALDPAQL